MQRAKQVSISLTLILFALFLRGCVFRPSSDYAGSHFNKNANAIWLGVEWVSEPQTDTAIESLGKSLTARGIRYLFAYTTYYKNSGTFNDNYTYATSFIQTLKHYYPDLTVLAWIGIPLTPGWGYADLNDSLLRQQLLDLAVELTTDYGFDGIHLDAEPIYDGDQRVLTLLTDLRPLLRADKLLSIATPAIFPVFAEQAPANTPLGWSADYYRQIAAHVEQLAVMSYDSGIGAEANWLYRQWMRFQVIQLTNALQNVASPPQLLLGVPVSEEHTSTHDPTVENIETALRGIIDGLNDAEAIPALVTGIAIYPHWEISDVEWTEYESRWLGQLN
ncbi:MAG: hypothetical protein KF726_18860 [Anaerolineae bacterium]|nr:hypothetical protein [Anaerolineae bacterium]